MNLPVFERLGVLDKLRALGVFKPGADFDADNARGYNTIAFARALGKSPPHVYQVWRADFDRMLFKHARENGVDAREGATVVAVEQPDRVKSASKYAVRTAAPDAATVLLTPQHLRGRARHHLDSGRGLIRHLGGEAQAAPAPRYLLRCGVSQFSPLVH